MRLLLRMTHLELRLFLREPLTALFALVLPIMVLFVMGGVFGNAPEAGFYRGMGAMDYYVPAYVALVAASVGLITLPASLAGNRERGVLKRYRASSMPGSVVVGSQVLAAVVVAAVSSMVLVATAIPVHRVAVPSNPGLVIAGFLLMSLALATLGVLLGALIPTARAAQALGVMLWFLFLMVGGAGPPPEVLSGAMGTVGDLTPLRHAVRVMQDGWLGLDAGMSWPAVAGMLGGFAALAIRFFRWE
jgi:ABC-2 type transport system permease protein